MTAKILHPTNSPIRPRNKAGSAPIYLPSYMAEGQLCSVCGDMATGLHYRAITCEGCKGFWRRTEQRHLDYVCRTGQEQCPINKDNRNGCQRCRYNKCKAVGMSSDLVLTENERAQKRDLIKENRVRKAVKEVLVTLKTPSTEREHQKELGIVIETVTKFYCDKLDLPLSQPDANGTASENAYMELLRPFVRRSREFAQAIKSFDQLNQEAQESLLRASLLEIHLLRFLSFYDPTEKCFVPEPEKKITVDVLQSVFGEKQQSLLKELLLIAEQVHELQMDLRQMAILAALFFFNPDNALEYAGILTPTHNVLWDAMRHIVDEESDGTDPKRWSLLMTRIFGYRQFCQKLEMMLSPANYRLFSTILNV